MSHMFHECVSLESLDLSGFDTGKVTNMSNMFDGCNSKNLDLSSFDTSNVTNMGHMFRASKAESIKFGDKFNTENITNMSQMFVDCDAKELDLRSFDTSNVTNMRLMFHRCRNLTSLDLSSFDAGSAKDMSSMFEECKNLKSIKFGNVNSQNVTDMRRMFVMCHSLDGLDLRGFKTGNVTNMEQMFNQCYSLTELDLSSFDTSNVTNMDCMFLNCHKLKKVNVSSFNTSKVEDFGSLFSECGSLTELDLGNFDIGSARSEDGVTGLLQRCSSLNRIQTPRNRKLTISLPSAGEGHEWQASDGTKVRNIAAGSDSLLIRKVQKSSAGTVSPITSSLKMEKIKITGISKQIAAGKKIKLTLNIQPSNAANKGVDWKSSNPKVATVNKDGVVTMKKNSGGKSVTITATAKDGSGA